MPTNRYAPVLSWELGGVETKNEIAELTLDLAVTDQVPGFQCLLENRGDMYTYGASLIEPLDHAKLKIDGALRFWGRVDNIVPEASKQNALLVQVNGRHIGAAALEDIPVSLQVAYRTYKDIVADVIAAYNAVRGANDPAITIISNRAPDDILASFRWQRKSFWKILQEIQEKLGATVLEGGDDQFYDFWLDPTTIGDFYFEEAGYQDSAVTITNSTEAAQWKRFIDGTVVKNDLWLWGAAKSGTIPIQMLPGYNTMQSPPVLPDPSDPWTEGNAADYIVSATGGGIGYPIAAENDADPNYVKVGTQSIKIAGVSPFALGTYKTVTWKIHFPAAGTGIVWPGQDPWNCLNAYNETEMSVNAGEMIGLDFWIRSTLSGNFNVVAVDYQGLIAKGPTLTINTPIYYLGERSSNWYNYVSSFGPSSDWPLLLPAGDPRRFHWEGVEYLEFSLDVSMLNVDRSSIRINFDGFKIVKPLVVNSRDLADGVRRGVHITKDAITEYAAARQLANALLEQAMRPQIYYEYAGLGRDDIPSGSTFTLRETSVLMREQQWKFDKAGAWNMTGRALEKT